MSSTDLVLRTAQEAGFTATAVELIRNTSAKGCSDEEVAQLLIIARQVYMIQRWDARAGRNVATPQTGIDGYRLIADRTNRYAPGRAPTLTYAPDGRLESATAYIKKLVGGQWHEVPATAYWDEYAQTKKDGSLTPLWEKMPRLMLAKCAEALALRRAFPAELSGLYTTEEMAQADNPTVTVEAEFTEVQPALNKPIPQQHPGLDDVTRKRLHALGKEAYGAGWDDKRHELARAVTKGRTGSSTELTQAEADTLIKGLDAKVHELRGAAEVEGFDVPEFEVAPEPETMCESCAVAVATEQVDGRGLCKVCAGRASMSAKRGKAKAAV
jgi:phage recombination protein Bet